MGYRVHTLLARRRHADRPGRRRRGARPPTTTSTRVRAFARHVDVVTFEFENVPSTAADAVEAARAGAAVGRGAAHHAARLREKTFLADRGFPDGAVRAVPPRSTSCGSAVGADRHAGRAQDRRLRLRRQGPAQDRRRRPTPSSIWTAHRPPGSGASKRSIAFRRRSRSSPPAALDGEFADFAPFENRHRNHILDVTAAPAAIPPAMRREAAEITRADPRGAEVVGVLCVEFFLSTDGKLLVNELAPRPHNSGHLTFDAARHEPVRAAGARHLRPAARLDRAARARRRWPTCSATSGRTASRTGPPPCRFPT